MRPDEHKKKKNAAYKAKHKIGGGESKSQGGKPKDKQVGLHEQPKNKDSESNSKITGSHSLAQPQDLGISTDSEEETRPQKRSYQRREIRSNWEKYDLRQEDDAPATIGESFEALLSRAGGATAHFRFKDEQEWDGDPAQDGGLDQLGHFLSVDAGQIGQAMTCLPVYEVLGLSPSIFPVNELDSINRHASEYRKLFLSPQEASGIAHPLGDLSSGSHEEKTSNFHSPTFGSPRYQSESLVKSGDCVTISKTSQPDLPNDSSTTHLANTEHTAHLSEPKRQSAIPDNSKTSIELNPHSTAGKNTKCSPEMLHKEGKLCLDDDDLDSLLDLDCLSISDKEQGNFVESSVVLPSCKPVKAVTTIIPQSPVKREVEATSNRTTKQEGSTKDGMDLEDWLDSVLDD